MRQITNKAIILQEEPAEKVEFELVRVGKGQIIGEITHVLKNTIFSFNRFANISKPLNYVESKVKQMALDLGRVQTQPI